MIFFAIILIVILFCISYLSYAIIKLIWLSNKLSNKYSYPILNQTLLTIYKEDDFVFDSNDIIFRQYPTTIGVKNPLGQIIKANLLSLFLFTKRKETLDFLILIVDGFQSTDDGLLICPNGYTTRADTFLSSLKVIPTTNIGEYYKETASFAHTEFIPFRIKTSNYAGVFGFPKKKFSICNKKGQILIELDFRKPVNKWGQTPSGYIGIDYKWFLSHFSANTMFTIVWIEQDNKPNI